MVRKENKLQIQKKSRFKVYIKTLSILVLSSIFIQVASAEQQNMVFEENNPNVSDNEIERMILFGTPDSLKTITPLKEGVNKIYKCNSPLTLAIRSVLGIQELGEKAPQYAIDKLKYLISIGADVNQETCSSNARYPLTVVLSMPLELDGYEDLAKQAIKQELSKKNEICNLAGIINKPCKDITSTEIAQLENILHQSFFDTKKMMMPYLMEMLSILVQNGADINKKDSIRGRTALHHAVEIPSDLSVEPIKYLLNNGADINNQDFNGDTPLFLAGAINNKEAVKILIEAGADTSIRNNTGVLYYETIGLRRKKTLQEISKEFSGK